MRFAVYARFSSDKQEDRSIDDQLRLCADFIQARGGTVVGTYTDYALSGTNQQRPELNRLMTDAKAGKFEAVCAEALDRLSRGFAHMPLLFEQLKTHNVQIITVNEQEVDEFRVGFGAILNSQYLKELSNKTRRGMAGNINAGRAASGITYGYRKVHKLDQKGEMINGLRDICPITGPIVTRIFEELAMGKSARAIASSLNADNIPSPSGAKWSANTITGNRQRGTGIQYNQLYIGFMIWNRNSFTRNPETGKRTSTVNDPSEWVIHESPDLRIIPQELWDQVHAIADENRPKQTHKRKRHKRLLSGLLTCGQCGGPMTSVANQRVGCRNRYDKGDSVCTNTTTITWDKVETRVLSGLKDKLMTPDRIKVFTRAWTQRMAELRASEGQRRDAAEQRLKDVTKKQDRIRQAIEAGLYDPVMNEQMTALARQADDIKKELEAMDQPGNVIDVHPNMSELYARRVDQLQQALTQDSNTQQQASSILRAMIDQIVIVPAERYKTPEITLHGSLAALLNFANAAKSENLADVSVMMVAGARFELTTFRL